MKILYVITGLGLGGAERVVCDLADKMYEIGHEIKIVYFIGEDITRPSYAAIEVIKIDLNNIRSLPLAYIQLAKTVKIFQPNVVHSHMVHANLLTRLVRLVVPMEKLISTAHNSDEGGRGRMLLYRVTHRLANTTTNVSKEATLAFEAKGAVPKNGMLSIYNGINLNKFNYVAEARADINKELNIPDDCKVILAVGRFNEQKDYPNLLNAIILLKQEATYSFKLLISGDGELRDLIEGIIDDLGLQDDVILLGVRHDIQKLMSAADLFVLSSRYEGFGLVVAEAMACKCLVVATDCGGVAEVLNNKEFLVASNDTMALKNKISYALNLDFPYKYQVIEKNLEHVQNNFSLNNVIKQWITLYNEK